MALHDLTTDHPFLPAAAGDPLTLVFGGSVAGPDGMVSQADLVLSAGLIAEIGSLVCLPASAELVDATGMLVRSRSGDAPLAPGQPADLDLQPLGSYGT